METGEKGWYVCPLFVQHSIPNILLIKLKIINVLTICMIWQNVCFHLFDNLMTYQSNMMFGYSRRVMTNWRDDTCVND